MKKIFVISLIIILILIIIIPAVVVMIPYEKKQGKLMKGLLIKVYDHRAGKIKKIPLEEYLIGVVAAEMPAKFDDEALKAQAVAARTYAVKRLAVYGAAPNEKHPKADICTDPKHCQAWVSKRDMIKRWGVLGYYPYYKKIRQAVLDTGGVVITYHKNFIDPVYHASCGGLGTENSEEVWKNQIPYLRGVNCPEDSGGQIQRTTFKISDVNKKIRQNLRLPSNISITKLKVIEKTSSGRIKKLELGGKTLEGTQIRAILGLRSTYFNWKFDGEKIIFTTRGYGHGVGLCQYGANKMAEQGKSFRDILKNYYKGAAIEKIY